MSRTPSSTAATVATAAGRAPCQLKPGSAPTAATAYTLPTTTAASTPMLTNSQKVTLLTLTPESVAACRLPPIA